MTLRVGFVVTAVAVVAALTVSASAGIEARVASGAWVAVSPVDGAAVRRHSNIGGSVNAVAADGKGGWFVGGKGVAKLEGREGDSCDVIHVTAAGVVDRGWCLYVAVGEVLGLARLGTRLYVAGTFNEIGRSAGLGSGASRYGLAAVDTRNARVLSWNAGVRGAWVSTIVLYGRVLYLGGLFYRVGGAARKNLAALDADTGDALPWNPGATVAPDTLPEYPSPVHGPVLVILPTADVVYVGGTLQTIGGVRRSGLAAVEVATGRVTKWNPRVSGQVHALARSGRTLYVGGWFDRLAGKPRTHVGAIDIDTGDARPWTGRFKLGSLNSGRIAALAVRGNTLYAGGSVATRTGANPGYAIAFDTRNGTIRRRWSPRPNRPVYVLRDAHRRIWLGGALTSVGA